MTAKQQWLAVLAVVVLLGGGAFTAMHFLRDELTSITVGSKAPTFRAKTLDAQPVVKTLANYRGEVVLLNIWGTFCIPCRTEMPSIEALYQDLGKKGLKVVAVSVDQPGFEQQIRDFTKEYKLSFDILFDDTGAIQQTYRATGVPETFIIGRDGVIHKKVISADDWNSAGNRKLIELLLAEPKS